MFFFVTDDETKQGGAFAVGMFFRLDFYMQASPERSQVVDHFVPNFIKQGWYSQKLLH